MTAFLRLDDTHVYNGLEATRGPWSVDHCHAGPPAGAIARSVEIVAGPDKLLTRLTLDLIRPIPIAGFRVDVEMQREGRKVSTAAATLTDLNGKICVTGSALLIAPSEERRVPTAPVAPLKVADARPGPFPIQKPAHDLQAFGSFVDVLYPEGEDHTPGPTSIWLKTGPLIEGETPSSFQRLCPMADSGNAISRNAELQEVGFVNPDLTIVAHRQTTSDWLLSETLSHWRPNGIGLAEARISDENGPIATALQSVILSPA
jgi:hypothetical protein